MSSLLLMGLLIGMRHALEADHLAALASLYRQGQSLEYTIRQGVMWGVGHTLMLLLFGAAVMLLDLALSQRFAAGLETAVGCMLLLLGGDLLRRLYRQRVRPVSVAGRGAGRGRQCAAACVPPEEGFPLRSLLVGLMHGMAGSAALTLMTVQTVDSPPAGMVYILLFGFGSIVGMALVSALIALPLRRLEKRRTALYNGVQLLLGCTTIGLGLLLIYQSHSGLVA